MGPKLRVPVWIAGRGAVIGGGSRTRSFENLNARQGELGRVGGGWCNLPPGWFSGLFGETRPRMNEPPVGGVGGTAAGLVTRWGGGVQRVYVVSKKNSFSGG